MEKERKRQKVIDPNHWMFRLHEFCWGYRPKYVGYCPLWWNTWINLGILPLATIFHFLRVMVSWVTHLWPEKIKVEESEKFQPAPMPDDDEIVYLYERTLKGGDPRDFAHKYGTSAWLDENPHWKSFYAAAKTRMIERKRLERIRDEENRLRWNAKEARQEKLAEAQERVVNWLKYLVKPGIALCACGIVWLTYHVVGWFISIFSWAMALKVAVHIGILAGIMCIAYLVVIVVKCLINWEHSRPVKVKPYKPEVIRKPNVFTKVDLFLGNILSAFIEGWEFIKNTIDIVYHRNCPLIVYSEDGTTRPIEKIPTSKDS